MVFTGIYEHTIDTKNRLAIPSEVRRRLRSSAGGGKDEGIRLYVTLDQSKQSLCVWPEKQFENRAAQLDQSQRGAQEMLAYERLFFSLTHDVEVDKQGRIRLPERLLEMSGLGGEVTVIGVNDHLEIWDRKTWDAFMNKRLDEDPELLMHPRQAMRNEDSQE